MKMPVQRHINNGKKHRLTGDRKIMTLKKLLPTHECWGNNTTALVLHYTILSNLPSSLFRFGTYAFQWCSLTFVVCALASMMRRWITSEWGRRKRKVFVTKWCEWSLWLPKKWEAIELFIKINPDSRNWIA